MKSIHLDADTHIALNTTFATFSYSCSFPGTQVMHSHDSGNKWVLFYHMFWGMFSWIHMWRIIPVNKHCPGGHRTIAAKHWQDLGLGITPASCCGNFSQQIRNSIVYVVTFLPPLSFYIGTKPHCIQVKLMTNRLKYHWLKIILIPVTCILIWTFVPSRRLKLIIFQKPVFRRL